jgi:hypothetical protein
VDRLPARLWPCLISALQAKPAQSAHTKTLHRSTVFVQLVL